MNLSSERFAYIVVDALFHRVPQFREKVRSVAILRVAVLDIDVGACVNDWIHAESLEKLVAYLLHCHLSFIETAQFHQSVCQFNETGRAFCPTKLLVISSSSSRR